MKRREPKHIVIEFDGETVTLENWKERKRLSNGVTVYVQYHYDESFRPIASIPDALSEKYKDFHAAPRIVSADWD